MFQKVKKRAVTTMFFLGLLLGFVGLILLICSNLGAVQLLQGAKPAASFDGYDISGRYVYANMDWTLGGYTEYTETRDGIEKAVARDYLVQLENGYWIAVRLKADQFSQADALADETFALMDEYSENRPQGFPIRGTVVDMEAEDIHYLRRTFGEEEIVPGCYGDGEILHRVIVDGEVGITGSSTSISSAWILTLCALACLIFAVLLPVLAGKKLWKKELVRYCRHTSSPENTMQRLKEFADTAPDLGLIKMNNQWILADAGVTISVLETPHVVWVYPQVTRQKLYGLITISKTHALCLASDNGKTVTISGSDKLVQETLKAVYEHTDHIMVGYQQELASMYCQKDYEGLREAARQIRENVQA